MIYRDVEELIRAEFEEYHKQDTELTNRRSQAVEFLKKCRWAVTDKSKFSQIIADLKDLNDGLYHFLSYTERQGLQQGLCHEVQTSENVEELQELETAELGCENVTQMASFKRQRISLEMRALPQSSSVRRLAQAEDLQISMHQVTLPDASGQIQMQQVRCMATYQKPSEPVSPVLIEWKSFDREAGDAVQSMQLSLIKNLAQLLHISTKPSGLCVPHCIGYIEHEWQARVGYVFQPPIQGEPFSPVSLREILSSSEIPHLGDRFRLAFELSKSLSILHKAGWLHKGIRSHNILFFRPSAAGASIPKWAAPRLENPNVVGFDYARPDDPNADSALMEVTDVDVQLYRHPDTQGPNRKRFCRTYDIYALGIVLLEIGLWRRSTDFLSRTYNPESFRRNLCDHYVPKLGAKAGLLYMNVVARCLRGDLANVKCIVLKCSRHDKTAEAYRGERYEKYRELDPITKRRQDVSV